MKIAIINGPNLNLLGKREPDIYGNRSFEDYFESLVQKYPDLTLSYFQSNGEGELVSQLHAVGFDVDGILINAGAYTHTSVAIGDALAAISSPALEIHISNIYKREDFRHKSFLSRQCVGMIAGLGLLGYELGLQYFIKKRKFLMSMLTFAPGPSKVFDKLPEYFQDAYQQGILSANHRSPTFMDLYRDTEKQIKEKLEIPEDYRLLFTSSATENWEIITQSLVAQASFHIYSGSFGKKWFGFAEHLRPETASLVLDKNKEFRVEDLTIPGAFDIIAITQNETSNATQISNASLFAIGKKFPDKMLAVDTTSSMGGIYLDFSLADIWFASVQKCFGLPAGLGLLVLSPNAIEKAKSIGEYGRYNSLNFMLENADNFQTHYTPNVLGIYLLNRVLTDMPGIRVVQEQTESRMRQLEQLVDSSPSLAFLVKEATNRSRTVLGVGGDEPFIKSIKKAAEAQGMQMGSGYGPLKPTSFRIANFPAITDAEFTKLTRFLENY